MRVWTEDEQPVPEWKYYSSDSTNSLSSYNLFKNCGNILQISDQIGYRAQIQT